MKILIIAHKLTGGGAERATSLWAKGFIERGHNVNITLMCRPNTPITFTVPPSVNVTNMFGWFAALLLKYFSSDVLYVKKIRNVIIKTHPDVIIGVMQPWTEIGFKAAKGLNIPIVNTEHNSFERPQDRPLSPLDYEMKYEWNKHYTYVTVLSEADKMCASGILNNLFVLPNPLAFSRVSTIPQKDKTILAVGRLNGWYVKGFDLLIKAWGQIAHLYPEWVLKIAGGGSDKSMKYLSKIGKEASLGSQLEFLGFVDTLSYYQRSSIFVMPSRFEGFGMALIEAMSQECACIACDYKGRQREIISSDNEGIIVEQESVESLNKSIRKLIEDEDYRYSLACNGLERSKAFDLAQIMRKWDAILNGIERINHDEE